MAQPATGDDNVDYADPFSFYGKAIIDHYHNSLAQTYGQRPQQLPPIFPSVLSHTLAEGGSLAGAPTHDDEILLPCPRGATKVGIIGAGVGGLYAAMMLQSLHIEYEILEASERIGGRLYTQHFSKKEHDYFDVGAMRFPKTPMMKRTFNLFRKLQKEAGLSLIPYIFDNDNSTLQYNSILMKRGLSSEDPQKWNVQDIPPDFAQRGWSKLVENVTGPFVDQLAEDFKRRDKTGWKQMMQYDQYSTRAYMSGNRSDAKPELDQLHLMPYPTPVVDWLETFDTSSASYDRALSEAVLDSLAFTFPQPRPVDWWCVDGGSQVIAEKMVHLLKRKPIMKSRVTAIALQGLQPNIRHTWGQAKVKLTFAGNSNPRTYEHVISTVTLPCLRAMDLSRASLTSYHNTALRELRYGPAVKIGVKFKTSWWTDATLMKKLQMPQYNFGPIVGGQSHTDRMVRTVVYPSYGEDGGERSTVLIVSYCWTEDANRWAALVGERSKEELKDIVLRDLVAVHGFYERRGYEFLASQWVDHLGWSWSEQPDYMGAFGFFGPGQFSYIYKHMTQPAAAGRLHFAGESLSTRHAWVVGALDASWRAVFEILRTSFPEKIHKFKQMWGSDEDWTDTSIMRHVCYSLLFQGVDNFGLAGAAVDEPAAV